jgi:hypothetical protein
MTPAPARRFYDAVVRAAQVVGLPDRVPELLVRVGLPGLGIRLGVSEPVDAAAWRMHRLADTMALEEARRIGDDLDAHQVEHFFAKGIALLGRQYQPGERTSSDIDLYVPPRAGTRAVQRLAALGYEAAPESQQSGPAILRSSLMVSRDGASPVPTTIDLHWALDPVTRLLPRRERPVPARFWNAVTVHEGLHLPGTAHHAALLVHHLVHSDLSHVRSALDVALLMHGERERPDAIDGDEYLAAARELGVARFARRMAALAGDDLGVESMAGAGEPGPRRLTLDQWLVRVARTPPDEEALITRARIRTRIRTVGWRAAPGLLGDVLFPPAAFLAWRWPGRRVGRALMSHYGQVLRKATGGPRRRSA